MWFKVVAFRGDVPFLNRRQARSMLPTKRQLGPRTFVSFGDEDEFQVRATPRELLGTGAGG
jgi:hypothetical protein